MTAADSSTVPGPGGRSADAVELAPRRRGEPAPQVHVYATGRKPVLRVRVGGRWRIALARQRLRFPDGTTAYRVILDAGAGHVQRLYAYPGPGLEHAFTPPGQSGAPAPARPGSGAEPEDREQTHGSR